MQRVSGNTRIHVALWLRSDEALETGEKKAKGTVSQATKEVLARRKAISGKTGAISQHFAQEYGERRFRADALAPVVYAELAHKEIKAIAKNPQIVGLFLYELECLEDLGNSIGIATSDDAPALGYKGSGVKVAVWEDAPDITTNLSIIASYKTSGFATSQHARHTHVSSKI